MKLILALLTGAALLTSAANVQAARPEPGRLPQGFGPSYPNEAFPSGITICAPQTSREPTAKPSAGAGLTLTACHRYHRVAKAWQLVTPVRELSSLPCQAPAKTGAWHLILIRDLLVVEASPAWQIAVVINDSARRVSYHSRSCVCTNGGPSCRLGVRSTQHLGVAVLGKGGLRMHEAEPKRQCGTGDQQAGDGRHVNLVWF